MEIVNVLCDYQTSSLDTFDVIMKKYEEENNIKFNEEQYINIHNSFFEECEFCDYCGWIHDIGELISNEDLELVCEKCYDDD